MKRRDLLRAGLAFAAASTVTSYRREARAFGEIPADVAAAFPPGFFVESVLEIMLLGGVSPWETFYCVPEYGVARDEQWNTFFSTGEIEAALGPCDYPSGEPLLKAFASDANGRTVHLGPYVGPLRRRSDLLQRLRLNVTVHGAPPHEIAIPLALTGRAPGHPLLAGMGAHVQRAMTARLGARDVPYSFVLTPPSTIQSELSRHAFATGRHPGTCRPVGLRMDGTATFTSLLQRPSMGSFASAHDDLVAQLDARTQARLTFDGQVARSRRFDDAVAARSAVTQASQLQEVIPQEAMDALVGDSCGRTTSLDATSMSIRLAARLLKHPTTPAKYVSVIDGGFGEQTNAGGYDTHANTSPIHATNLDAALRALTSIVNAPGEGDPNKLDLDKTLIVLNTEFGRTPYAEANRGRGHWPHGYVVAFLGGPVVEANAGIRGAIGEDAGAVGAASPLASRAASLAAMGIWPFEPDVFNVGDLEASTTPAAVDWLVGDYMGRST